MFDQWTERLADVRAAAGETGKLTLTYVWAPG